MFKTRLNFALSLIKEYLGYYIALAVVIALGIFACAVKGSPVGVVTCIILGIVTWIGMDVSVYYNYIRGEGSDED